MRFFLVLIVIFEMLAAPGAIAASSCSTPFEEGWGVPGPGCDDGLVLDDGSFETAYGWVSSAVWGEYVQTFQIGTVEPVVLESVCVCWTRTSEDDSLDFEIEVYEDADGLPADEPLMVVDASMAEVPLWSEGQFTEVAIDVDEPLLAPGTYHIGVRWSPSVDQLFFVCADQSNPAAPVPGFFRDDRADGEWGLVLETSDPIFDDHTAMLIRIRARELPAVPTSSPVGVALLIGLIAGVAGWLLRRTW